MAMLARPDGNGPFFEYNKSRAEFSSPYQEVHLVQTTAGELFHCKSANQVDFHVLKDNWRFAFAKTSINVLQRIGLIQKI